MLADRRVQVVRRSALPLHSRLYPLQSLPGHCFPALVSCQLSLQLARVVRVRRCPTRSFLTGSDETHEPCVDVTPAYQYTGCQRLISAGSAGKEAVMIKVLATVIRRPHVSHEELVKVWETVHAPHVVKIAQPERYRITFFDQRAEEDDPGLDGMAELWFRDTQHYDTGIGRNAPPEIMDDGFSDYADIGKGTWLTVTEHVIVDGPTTRETTKFTFFVKRREGVARETLQQYWLNTHVPNVAAAIRRTAHARRYTVNLVDGGKERLYDGIAHIWLDGHNPSLADLAGLAPDDFPHLVRPLLLSRGHEIRIVD